MAAKIHFYLKKPAKGTGESLVILKLKSASRSFVWSTGESVRPDLWNFSKQRCRSNKIRRKLSEQSINSYLDDLEKRFNQLHRKKNLDLSPGNLRAFLMGNTTRQKYRLDLDFYALLQKYIHGDRGYTGKQLSPSSIRSFSTLRRHLDEFETRLRVGPTKTRLSFGDITVDFLHRYFRYFHLHRSGARCLSYETTLKDIKLLRTILNKATRLGIKECTWCEADNQTVRRWVLEGSTNN